MFKEPAAPTPQGKKQSGLSRLVMPYRKTEVKSDTVSDEEVEDLFKDAKAEEPLKFEAKDSERGQRVAKMKFEEELAKAERARAQEQTESAAMVDSLRAKMGLTEKTSREKMKKQHLAVSAEELAALREHGENVEAMQAQARGVLEYGGEVKQPIEGASAKRSETSFRDVGASAEAAPAMFSLKDLEAQEEKPRRPARRGPTEQQPPASAA